MKKMLINSPVMKNDKVLTQKLKILFKKLPSLQMMVIKNWQNCRN